MEKHIFISADGTRLTLPVTPKDYNLHFGMDKTIVTLFQTGDYVMPGRRTVASTALECMLPAQKYPFCVDWQEPEAILQWLQKQVEERNRVMYVITEANQSGWYYITDVSYGEQDGTGDIYAKITILPAPTLEASVTEGLPTESGGSLQEEAGTVADYVVKAGDNLWTICRSHYHDGSLCYKLAEYNGIENANIIFAGQKLMLPPADYLR